MNFYTITGGPGSGKTALINELRKRGYRCLDEVARQIIQEQESIGGEGVPWKDLKLYKNLMLSRFIETYNIASSTPNETIFFDRDILDLISYDIVTKTESSEELRSAAQRLVYNKKVFVAPPWKEIYTIDFERKQTFEEAIEVYENIVQVYRQFGREIILLPKTNVKDRADFVIKSITGNKGIAK